ncbi:MAG: SDR family oxidoreductase [Phycisphaerae bacterium]|nr:SDR family oxidoreductase [Phycisphaerae bacterium]
MPSIQDLFRLQGRVFLVVGGARNLGWDMAVALAEAGADGAITSRDSGTAQASAKQLAESTSRNVIGMGMDATDETQVRQGVEEMIRRFGRIDVLINCVGGIAMKAAANLEDRPLDAWETLHRTNVTAPFLVCKYIVPVMRKQKSGSIINIASIAGLVGRDRSVYLGGMPPQTLDYAAAKGAVIGFTRDLAAYVGQDGIRANAISPGGFERGQPREFIEAYSRKCILGRMGRDGIDIKGAAVFLASDASAYVTGHNLVVDGGFTVWQ